jgi:hypothetical protein
MAVIQQLRVIRPTTNERGGQHLSFGSEADPGMRCGGSQSIMNFSYSQGKFLSHQENWHKLQFPPAVGTCVKLGLSAKDTHLTIEELASLYLDGDLPTFPKLWSLFKTFGLSW